MASRALGLILGLGLAIAASPARAAPPRWPTWPSEVRRVASPLVRDARGKERVGERQRVASIQALDPFATGAILEPLLHALGDASPQVRREALRMCFEREVVACIPSAASLWSAGGEPTVRIAALKVLALDPEPSRAAILIEALRDPSETIRIQAADFLGTAPLPPEVRPQARTALLAKLADVSVAVRRRAVLSLGLLGPGKGTLSIARLLDDPEPTVRSAAATALGRYRDADAIPALRRAIAAPNDSSVSLSIIQALAVLPDPSIEDELLGLLDRPPLGLNPLQIATAIGRRPTPSQTLTRGLVARLDESALHDAVLAALLMHGQGARSTLEAALAQGLSPPLQIDVERLLAALDAGSSSGLLPERWPDPDEQTAWRSRLRRGDALQRRRGAWTLAQHDPAWRVPAAVAELGRHGPLAGRRVWAFTLAASPTLWESTDDLETRARLEGWARDRRLSIEDRCLALAALGAHRPEPGRRATNPWTDLREDPEPRVRSCAALALGRQGDAKALAGLLVDSRSRVRTAAALGLAAIDAHEIDPSTRARLALLAVDDPQPSVRAAASLASKRDEVETAPDRAPGLFMRRVDRQPWSDPPRSLEVELRGRRLWLPSSGRGLWRWALIPGLSQAEATDAIEVLTPRSAGL